MKTPAVALFLVASCCSAIKTKSEGNSTDAGQPCFFNEKMQPAEPCSIEHNSRAMIRKYVREDATVLEVGARYGSVACTIAETQKQSGKVVSVEPDHRVWAALAYNLKHFGCNVHVFHGVVGTTSMRTVPEGDGGYGTRTVAASVGTADALPISLKDLEAKFGLHFNTVNADCEGCFPVLLRENPELVKQTDTFIVEVHNAEEHAAVEQLLTQGFQLVFKVARQHVLIRKTA
eukprot:TRINITY_DN24899_c0_g3_i1.p1 TRINITY_DN24899_c0_g3~~TRINITY_DN24899_c0_g3_i1.p1  ORF type:complete len:252 (+),score=34.39 TRINITY_DN24899_c0_g3_i1:63-758(+)